MMQVYRKARRVESSEPCDPHTRTIVGQCIRFNILRKLQRDAHANGGVLHLIEFLAEQRAVCELAQAHSNGVLPTAEEWLSRLSQSDGAGIDDVRKSDPDAFARAGIEVPQGRRLLRLGQLEFPHCPGACLLAFGPEAAKVGDVVCLAAGAMVPLVLRKSSAGESAAAMQQYRFVGEAYVNGAGEPVDMFQPDADWPRVQII